MHPLNSKQQSGLWQLSVAASEGGGLNNKQLVEQLNLPVSKLNSIWITAAFDS